MQHELKIWPQYYDRVEDGSKTFEVRKNDRSFQVGDTVLLREWNPFFKEGTIAPEIVGYTGRVLGPFKIGYVHPLRYEDVVFSLIKIPETKAVTREAPPNDCF